MKKLIWVLGILILVMVIIIAIGQTEKNHVAVVAPSVASVTPVASPAVPAMPSTTAFTDQGDDVNGTHIGYIKSISTSGSVPNVAAQNTYSMSVDYVQWLSCANCPDDYQVKNDNTQLRTLTISPDADIYLQTYSHDTPDGSFDFNQQVSLQDFVKIFYTPTAEYTATRLLYWFTIKNGIVTTITEQYQP